LRGGQNNGMLLIFEIARVAAAESDGGPLRSWGLLKNSRTLHLSPSYQNSVTVRVFCTSAHRHER